MRECTRIRASAGQQGTAKLRTLGRRIWREWRMVILFVVFVVVPVKSSVADWNWVPTGSMNPTILEGDLIYVNKIAYDLRVPLTLHRLASWSEPQRGDIVVCLSPEDGTRLVKRVIGRPGDTVQMSGNVLLLNGRPLRYNETGHHCPVHLSGDRTTDGVLALEDLGRIVHPVLRIPGVQALRSFGPVVIPPGCYFVLGDNRDVSRDSRYFGVIPGEAILGQARAVVLSFNLVDKYQPRLGRFFTQLR